MTEIPNRLRAWAADASTGKSINGADFDLRRAAEKIEAMELAIELALEYWADRQQRYKNRYPRWVAEAKIAKAL